MPMEQFFLFCAIFGGAFVVVQTAMTLLGVGGHDMDGAGSTDVDLDGVDSSFVIWNNAAGTIHLNGDFTGSGSVAECEPQTAFGKFITARIMERMKSL